MNINELKQKIAGLPDDVSWWAYPDGSPNVTADNIAFRQLSLDHSRLAELVEKYERMMDEMLNGDLRFDGYTIYWTANDTWKVNNEGEGYATALEAFDVVQK